MDRRISKTKAAIQKAYIDLLMEKKPGKITISEIARRADVDRKTFYLHYNAIEDIIREFTQNEVDKFVEQLKLEKFPEKPFGITRLFEILNQMVEENLDFFQFISVNKEYDYFFDQIKELFVTAILDNYRELFNFPENELKIYAEFFISGIISAYVRWLRERLPISKEELAGLVSGACYDGLQSLLPDQILAR